MKQPSPSKMTAKQVADETLRLQRGGGVQHRLGEVEKRSSCNVAACRQANARLGCQRCRIHLCSPECYNAYVFDDAELAGKCCATFLDISNFKQKRRQENKAHRKAATAAPARGRSLGPCIGATLSMLSVHLHGELCCSFSSAACTGARVALGGAVLGWEGIGLPALVHSSHARHPGETS